MSEPSSAATPAIFLSYAREDAEAARRIAEALRSSGVEVWFDQNELRGGDTWDAKIRKQINDCTLFLPIISHHTQERNKGYFRLEWKLAVEQTHLMLDGVPFLAPVVVDETPESGAAVPPEFMKVQWTRLPGALPTPQFVAQVQRLLGGRQPQPSVGRGFPNPSSTAQAGSGDPALQRRKSGSWLIPTIVGVIVAVGLAVFMLRKPATAPAPAPVAAAPAEVEKKPAVSADKSIAVLPFTNMSEDKESGYFADGVHEDILTNLALVRELRVVSRTSVMAYRSTTKSMRQIAQELGVTYILEGSVRRSGNKVRVTGQLIHAASDEHVWAQAYDRDLTDIFSIQAELSQQIAGALKAALSPEEKALLVRRPTENLAAYDAYLKARQLRQMTAVGLLEAEPLLDEAVRLDPKFALGWAELASMVTQAYFNDVEHSDARLAKAKAAIDTAVRLAPDDPDVIERLGDYYYYGFRDYEKATEQYLRLAGLRPNDAAVFGSLGFIHRRQGRWVEAMSELKRAADLEPRDLRFSRTLGEMYVGLNRFPDATAVGDRMYAQFPDVVANVFGLASVPFLARGSIREGEEIIARLKPALQNSPEALYLRKAWTRAIGDWEGAIKLDAQQRYFDGFGEGHWSQDASAAFVLWAHGDQAAARALAGQAIPPGKADLAQKPSATGWANLSTAYALVGDKAEALRCAQTAKDMIPEAKDAVAGAPLSVNYAQVLAWCGEKDRAIAELARLLRTPYGENIHNAKASCYWLPLHGDPRFEALVNDEKNNTPMF
jgi:TolB-like protein/Flp pilus assembly protein TadD